MRAILLLVLAASLEVGGDALVRWGLKGPKHLGLPLGALVLFAYGLSVNLPKNWDFGRLMGVYIAVFFVVSQVVAAVIFHEKLQMPALVGGALIVAGGLMISLWRVA